MKQFTYTVKDPLGFHVRPAGQLSGLAKTFADTTVTVAKDGAVAKTSQLMRLMSLGIRQGDTVTVTAEGPLEDEALAAVERFFRDTM